MKISKISQNGQANKSFKEKIVKIISMLGNENYYRLCRRWFSMTYRTAHRSDIPPHYPDNLVRAGRRFCRVPRPFFSPYPLLVMKLGGGLPILLSAAIRWQDRPQQ